MNNDKLKEKKRVLLQNLFNINKIFNSHKEMLLII